MNIPLLRQIADKEMLTSLFYKDYSIINGQMGTAIFFAFLSRVCDNHWYEDFASELLDSVISNTNISMPVNFAYGLCGIGWGIEFLKHHGFLEDDTDEILSEIDAAVMERDVRRITDSSFETGMGGICAYVSSRLSSKRKNSGFNPFDPIYLSDLETSATRLCGSYPTNTPDEVWNICINTFATVSGVNWKKGLCHIFKEKVNE